MLVGLFLTSLSFPTVALAQNIFSGKLINAPGSSSQDIPVRWITMDTHELFPDEIISDDIETNSSEAYSFSYSGGPFFSFNEMDVYVNPGLNANPLPDVSFHCISTADITLIYSYVDGNSTLTNLQKIAADVNIDGIVTRDDGEMINDVLVGFDDYFTNSISVGGSTYINRSILYPTSSEVAALGDTIELTYTYNYIDPNIPTRSNTGRDFYSVRLGDVTGSCGTYNGLQEHEVEIGIKQFDNSQVHQDNSSDKTRLFPNPVSSDFSITTTKEGLKKVTILDLSGSEIYQNSDLNSRKEVNISNKILSNFPSGIYLVEILFIDGSKATKRFVKE